MSESALLAVISGPLILAIIGAIGYIWKQRDRIYEQTITKQEGEIKAYREKIAELQDKAIATMQTQLAEANRRIETDERIAATIARQGVTLERLAGAHEAVAEARRAVA